MSGVSTHPDGMSVSILLNFEPSRFSPHLIAPSPDGSVFRRSLCAGVAASTTAPPRFTTSSSSMSSPLNARGSTDVPPGKKSSTIVLKTHDGEASSKVAATIDYDDGGGGGDDLQYGKTLKSRFAAIAGGKGVERRETRGNGRVLVGRKANLEERSGGGPVAAVDAALPATTAAAAYPATSTAAAAAPDGAARAADDIGPGLVPSPVHEGAGSRWDNIRAA